MFSRRTHLRITGLLLAAFAAPALLGGGGAGAQRPVHQTLSLVATDGFVASRRTVAVVTGANDFAVLLIPATARVASGSGGTYAPARIRAGHRLACRGVWADAARTTFRAAQVTVGPALTADALADRVAAACRRVEMSKKPPAGASRRPAPRPSPAAAFVVESVGLVRDDAAPVPDGQAAYRAAGMLRNGSNHVYERLEVQVSVFDNQGRRVADQSARLRNLRPGDRARFAADPPLYLPFLAGHTVRVDRLFIPPAD